MQPAVRCTILEYIAAARPGKLLDIPAGACWLADSLGAPGWEYSAADLFVDSETPNFKKADLNECLPYGDAEFDYVTCLEGLEHIENYHHALREFHRILKPSGVLLISTPNPLNIKSRLRYLTSGTFNGFPHLVRMPKEGEHVHISPINLSFLISFAQKYGLALEKVHKIQIEPGMYRYALHCALLRAYGGLRMLGKDVESKTFWKRLIDWNILLNDNIVVSFRKI